MRAPVERQGHRQRRGLPRGVERNRRLLGGGTRIDGHRVEREVRSVEHDGGCRLFKTDANRFGSTKAGMAEVHHERQIVVGGDGGCRQALREGAGGGEQAGRKSATDTRPHAVSVLTRLATLKVSPARWPRPVAVRNLTWPLVHTDTRCSDRRREVPLLLFCGSS